MSSASEWENHARDLRLQIDHLQTVIDDAIKALECDDGEYEEAAEKAYEILRQSQIGARS